VTLFKHLQSIVVVTACWLATPAAAQDVFGTTGSSVHSYNYVEFQYLVNIDTDLPLFLTALVDINESLSFNAEYIRLTDTVAANGLSVDVEGEGYGVGLVYHEPFTRIPDTDWFAGFLIGRITATGEVGDVRASVGDNFQEVYTGLRRTLSPKLEGEVGVNLFRADSTDVTLDVRFVYRFRPSYDIAFGISEIGNDSLFGIGLRYAW